MGVFPTSNKILVINGAELALAYQHSLSWFKKRFKGQGFQLKELRIHGKTYRYWYSWRYNAAKKNHDWKYLGKKQPVQLQEKPPVNPLAGVDFETVGHDLLVSEGDYAKIKHVFSKHRTFTVTG